MRTQLPYELHPRTTETLVRRRKWAMDTLAELNGFGIINAWSGLYDRNEGAPQSIIDAYYEFNSALTPVKLLVGEYVVRHYSEGTEKARLDDIVRGFAKCVRILRSVGLIEDPSEDDHRLQAYDLIEVME